MPPRFPTRTGDTLARHIDHVLAGHLPTLPGFDEPPEAGRPAAPSLPAQWARDGYNFLCALYTSKFPVTFIVFVTLGLLTLLSWVSHWRRRAWSVKGLDLPENAESRTAPLPPPPPRPADPAPVNVTPVD